jgi:hypothetical protein
MVAPRRGQLVGAPPMGTERSEGVAFMSVMIEDARYRCTICEREWDEELSPLWAGFDMWPTCCERLPFLIGRVSEDRDIIEDSAG